MAKDIIKLAFFFAFVLNATKAHSFNIYASGSGGFWIHHSPHLMLDKYAGALGIEVPFFAVFSLGTEARLFGGQYQYSGPLSQSQKAHVSEIRGLPFLDVVYFDLMVRPKLQLPFPLLQPYLVFPLGLTFGGIHNWTKSWSMNASVLLGVSLKLAKFLLFLETGPVYHKSHNPEDLRRRLKEYLDFTALITLGVGYEF